MLIHGAMITDTVGTILEPSFDASSSEVLGISCRLHGSRFVPGTSISALSALRLQELIKAISGRGCP